MLEMAVLMPSFLATAGRNKCQEVLGQFRKLASAAVMLSQPLEARRQAQVFAHRFPLHPESTSSKTHSPGCYRGSMQLVHPRPDPCLSWAGRAPGAVGSAPGGRPEERGPQMSGPQNHPETT